MSSILDSGLFFHAYYNSYNPSGLNESFSNSTISDIYINFDKTNPEGMTGL